MKELFLLFYFLYVIFFTIVWKTYFLHVDQMWHSEVEVSFMLSGHNNYIKNTSSFKLLCTTTPVVIYCRATRGFIKLLCIRAALPPHTIVLQCFSQRFQLLRLSLQDIRMLFAINQVSERSNFSCLSLPAAPSLKCNITANHRYVKFVRFRRI